MVPHPRGQRVKAEVLVLGDSTHEDEAKSLLWRRETRKEGSGERYRDSCSPDAVVIRETANLTDLDHLLYTDFNSTGKIDDPDPRVLAAAAVDSVLKAPSGRDGISYLMELVHFGVMTPLTARYQVEILTLTDTSSLEEALAVTRRN